MRTTIFYNSRLISVNFSCAIFDHLFNSIGIIVDTEASRRINKYKHRFCNTTFGNLQLTELQKSILCVLFLRGRQIPGELRARTQRLADFDDVSEVEVTLEQLPES
ncbi:DUF480 domain-containing protein [Psychromonas sp. SP041]|uniref:DUF480 domain-containing protein n=1 Tax=Psychromonas sp. SP041 TaxID=1365007 RepID=UPI001F0E83B1|nr:DUF480 domain-containing protein [Psychromonas sp. SP041]